MRREEFPQRGINLTCQSGNTSALIVPANVIAHLTELEIDSAGISGAVTPLTVKIYDTFSGSTVTRKQVSIDCGDVIHVAVNNQPLLQTIAVNSNVSGPIVTLGYTYEM